MLILVAFAFMSGLATILAPCIWPLLPIILSASISHKGHRRALGITLGIILSFSVFTLSLSYLLKLFNFDPNNLRFVAAFIIGALGFITLVPALSKLLELGVSRLSSLWGGRGQQSGTSFAPGFITGLSLGIVWAPCGGPILAAIAALASTGQVSWQVVAITFAYAIGIGIPLFLIAYGGQKVVACTRRISPYTGRIQQLFGLIMIISAVTIYTNYDKIISLRVLTRFPALAQLTSGFEQSEVVREAISTINKTPDTPIPKKEIKPIKKNYMFNNANLFNENKPAPELTGINNWLNTDHPITLAELKGKVVLVDFWTYTCINCIRTLPHVTGWYEKYKNQGFTVIGVHTPEFAFERDPKNVIKANAQYNINYPVAQDNDYATWRAYSNQYWPAEYLIDSKGIIRRTHFGEGKYDEMEAAIQALLAEAGQDIKDDLENTMDLTPQTRSTPEAYLGSDRVSFFYPTGSYSSGKKDYSLVEKPPINSFSMGGAWTIENDYAVAGASAALTFNFQASKVFLVLRPPANTVARMKVYLDGELVNANQSGSDVKDGITIITGDRLYNLIDLRDKAENHILKLEFETPGTEAFAFTFG